MEQLWHFETQVLLFSDSHIHSFLRPLCRMFAGKYDCRCHTVLCIHRILIIYFPCCALFLACCLYDDRICRVRLRLPLSMEAPSGTYESCALTIHKVALKYLWDPSMQFLVSRAGFTKGNITLGQFLQAFPFGGTSSTLKLKVRIWTEFNKQPYNRRSPFLSLDREYMFCRCLKMVCPNTRTWEALWRMT